MAFAEDPETDVAQRRDALQADLQAQPDDLSTLIELAGLEGRAGNQDVMLEYLNRAMQAHPAALQPRLVLGRYYLVQKNPVKAEQLLGGVAVEQRANSNFLSAMASAQMENGNYAGALESLLALAQYEPDKPAVFYLQARAYGELSQPVLMQQALQKTIELDPSHFPARLALARLLLVQGETDAAAAHVQLLQAQAPDHPDVIRLVASLNSAQAAAAQQQ